MAKKYVALGRCMVGMSLLQMLVLPYHQPVCGKPREYLLTILDHLTIITNHKHEPSLTNLPSLIDIILHQICIDRRYLPSTLPLLSMISNHYSWRYLYCCNYRKPAIISHDLLYPCSTVGYSYPLSIINHYQHHHSPPPTIIHHH